MILVDVYTLEDGEQMEGIIALYQLLEDRPLQHGISHRKMPSFAEHDAFFDSRPFRYWYLIKHPSVDWTPITYTGRFMPWGWIGAIECLPTNEFGIHLFKEFQGKGFGRQAVELFLSTHEPLPAIPAVRNGHFTANCAPANEGAIEFFKALGFHEIQRTFEK